MTRIGPILLLFSSFLQAQQNSADVPADIYTSQQLIERMSDATKKLNYAGVFVFTRGDEMDVMRMLHKADANGEREKIVSLTGPAREIIRNNQTVTCIFPDTQEVMVERSRAQNFTTKLAEPIEAIASYYQFSTMGSERIAGRDSWMVNVTPKDEFRYGYRLWIDQETFLLLKSELTDEAGVALEVVMFTELELPESIDDGLFTPTITGKEYTRYEYVSQDPVNTDTGNSSSGGQWQVSWLPAGFNLSDHSDNTYPSDGDFLKHLIYTDGVSMVSIFIEKIGAETAENLGSMNFGGVNVYARSMGEYQVTTVGEVPRSTVMRIGDSVLTGR